MIVKKNITYSEFEEYCEKIKKILINNFNETSLLPPYQYENQDKTVDLSNKIETIFLSSGDVFKYSIPKSSIAHLLGITTEYLNKTSLFLGKDSYSILLELINNPYKYYQKYTEGLFDFKYAISPYIDIKIKSFFKNLEMNINNCEFVCKYQKERSYGYGEINTAYLVLSKHDDKYYVLMLDKFENKNQDSLFVPKSNRMYESKEEVSNALSSILFNQELTILNGKSVKKGYKESQKFWIPKYDRINKIDTLNEWSKNLDCIPNTIADYKYLVNIFDNAKSHYFHQSDVLADISELMKNKKIIDINTSNLSPEVVEIINAYNDSLNYGESIENEAKFSDVLSRKNELEQKLKQALKEKTELESKYNEIKQKYEDSVTENQELTNKLENVRKALG